MSIVNLRPVFFHIILFFVLVILPFVFWPFSPIPFEIPRVFFVHRAIELLAVSGLIILLTHPKNILQKTLVVPLILYTLIATASLLWSINWQKSVVGNVYRADGLITLWRLSGFALLLGSLWKQKYSDTFSISVTLGAIGVSVLTISSYLLHTVGITFFSDWQGTFGSTFGQPNFLGGYLVVTVPFCLYLYKKMKSNHLYFVKISLAVQIIALLLTGSLGSIGTVVMIFIGSFILRKNYSFKNGRLVAGGIVILLLLSFSLIFALQNRLPVTTNAESRGRIFTKLAIASAQKPLLGWGWANVDLAFSSIDWPYKFNNDVYVDKAHSTLLEIFVTTGLIGFCVYIVFLCMLLTILWKKSREKPSQTWWQTLLLVTIGYIVHTQTNVTGIAEEFLFWCVVGIIAADTREDHLITS